MRTIKGFFRLLISDSDDVSTKRMMAWMSWLFLAFIAWRGIFYTVPHEGILLYAIEVFAWLIAGLLGLTSIDKLPKGIGYLREMLKRKKAEPEPEPVPVVPVPEVNPVEFPESPAISVDLSFIKKHEGCRLNAYLCPGGRWTIGYGSTTHPGGMPVKKGDSITQDQAEEYLIYEANKRLNDMQLPKTFNRNKRTALLSWQYNCGQSAWMKSGLRSMILSGKSEDKIRKQWASKYITSKGKVFSGLLKRRQEEADLFFK